MKTDFIQCAWNESCGKSVKREFEKTSEGTNVTFSRCKTCGNFTVQNEV